MYIEANISTLRAMEIFLSRPLNNFSSKFVYLLFYADINPPFLMAGLTLSSNSKRYTEM
jgi:hypothetical protein